MSDHCHECGGTIGDEWVQAELAEPGSASGTYRSLGERVKYHPGCFPGDVEELRE